MHPLLLAYTPIAEVILTLRRPKHLLDSVDLSLSYSSFNV